MVARIKDREYADRQLTTFPGGFVQQHVLKGKRVHDEGEVRLPCAIICKVAGGKITRLDEYFDSAPVAEFRKLEKDRGDNQDPFAPGSPPASPRRTRPTLFQPPFQRPTPR